MEVETVTRKLIATALVFLSLSAQAREMIACSMMDGVLQQECCCPEAIGCNHPSEPDTLNPEADGCCVTLVSAVAYTSGKAVTASDWQPDHQVNGHLPASAAWPPIKSCHGFTFASEGKSHAGTRTYLLTARLRL